MLRKVYEERRAVNSFDQEKKLPEGLLKEIIDLSVLAPSAFNLQPWRIIAVETEEGKDKLLPLAFNQPKIKEAPVTLIIVADKDGYKEDNPVWDELKSIAGEEKAKGAMEMAAGLYGTTEERQLKFAESNAGLLSMSIMYAAKGLGVDSHPMSGMNFEGIHESFGLKPSETVVMLISLGYHNQEQPLYPRRMRRGYDDIVESV